MHELHRIMPRTKRTKSANKQRAISENTAINAWRVAAKELGYLTKGVFRPIPPKGSPEYNAIKKRQAEITAQQKPAPAQAAPAVPAQPAVAAAPVETQPKPQVQPDG
jgi:hypothetical protein